MNNTVLGNGYKNVAYRHLIMCDVDTSPENYPKYFTVASFVVDS
jgi:hypothetical protein